MNILNLNIRRPSRALALLAALALGASACGGSSPGSSESNSATGSSESNSATGSSESNSATGSSESNSATGSSSGGSITVTGSSTVEPITNLLAEAFAESNPDVAMSVTGPGSGDGHKAACAGEVPIWNSSRQMKDSEAECFADAGIEFIEFRVAIDGISVITAAGNTNVDCLNFADLYSLISVESTGFDDWSDANELNSAVGGTGPFGDSLSLEIFAPGEESGTFDSFIEIALEDVWEARVESGDADEAFAVRPDYNASANDNVIIDGVAGNAASLGWVGFAFADGSRDQVKLLEIDGGDGCVAPTPETIASADFPIARFLYTYVDVASAEDPAIEAFVDFMLSDEGQAFVIEAGYVNLAEVDLEQGRTSWAERTTGRTF
ncbi:MAG: phosphate transport system substrate-binding protein [Candidatus Poriferisodalaceae bacterium]